MRLVLAAALLVATARALSCYSCSDRPDHPTCKIYTNCSEDLGSYCMKVKDYLYTYDNYYYGGRSLQNTGSRATSPASEDEPAKQTRGYQDGTSYRSCSALCREGRGSNGDYYSYVYCCSTDLCNSTSSVRLSGILLLLAAAILLRNGL
ncbi:hypothetical protein NDU88_005111 [Pleurodeles waltl]|uniref:Snake toxin/toxin-like domain-containing protein n=1 Tax=Pleurodeles waltl TaxID=8319 RepID=A0AAV7V326_PLEWA|nr:hypothetical protein NDU88_005111 [Pleurodeles waltl]